MALSEPEFKLLVALHGGPASSQRDLACKTGISLGGVNKLVRALAQRGLVRNLALTAKGRRLLAPCKVRRGIVIACALPLRSAFVDRGFLDGGIAVWERALINRSLLLLREAGVAEVEVLSCAPRDSLSCFEQCGAVIAHCPKASCRGSACALLSAGGRLANAYVVSAGTLLAKNLFSSFERGPFYAAGIASRRDLLGEAHAQLIPGGFAYFDRTTARRFTALLAKRGAWPEHAGMTWEEATAHYASALRLSPRVFEKGMVRRVLRRPCGRGMRGFRSGSLDYYGRARQLMVPLSRGGYSSFAGAGELFGLACSLNRLLGVSGGLGSRALESGIESCFRGLYAKEAACGLKRLFEREMPPSQLRRCAAFAAIVAHYRFVLALHQESQGCRPDGQLYDWFCLAREYAFWAWALHLGEKPAE